MKSHYRAVVIGGGVVGASVIYHLSKFGWKDICLLERSVLSAGSSWHAAGGIHALNADPNMSALQAYTIDLLPQVEKESGEKFEITYVPENKLRTDWKEARDPMQKSFAGLKLCLAKGDPINMDKIRKKFPVKLTSVKEYARFLYTPSLEDVF